MLFSALHVSQTGIVAADFSLDIIGNNVANSGTVGYKTARVTFQDLVSQTLAEGRTPAVTSQTGGGVRPAAVTGVFTQGQTQPSGAALDVAVEGDGFLAVALPDGRAGFTRRGNLALDAAGNLVTADGFRLVPPVTVPAGSTSVAIEPDGRVTAVTPDGSAVVGRIGLVRFADPAGLVRVGDTGFVRGVGSEEGTLGVPGTAGFGSLRPEALEGSNVDLTTELTNLLVAQRVFTANTQALAVSNAALESTVELIQL